MFIVGGSNAYPAEIERALSEHPAIKQAYVVGVPDPRLGEVGFAFVELRRDAELDRDGVTEFCKGRLADFKVPRHIEFVDRVAADRDRQDPALPAARARRGGLPSARVAATSARASGQSGKRSSQLTCRGPGRLPW